MAMKLVSFAALSAFAIPALAAQNVVVVDDLKPGITINKTDMMAADLAIWNPPSRYYGVPFPERQPFERLPLERHR